MPKPVDDADKEADRIHREMYPDQYPADEKDGDSPPKDSEKDGEVTNPPDEGNKDDVANKQDDTPPPSDSDGTPKVPDAPETEKQAMEDFQQKYYVLKGKYDAEVPRLHSDLSALRTVVTDLQKQISTKVDLDQDAGKTKGKETPTNEALAFVEKEYPDIYNAMVSLWSRSRTVNQMMNLQYFDASRL